MPSIRFFNQGLLTLSPYSNVNSLRSSFHNLLIWLEIRLSTGLRTSMMAMTATVTTNLEVNTSVPFNLFMRGERTDDMVISGVRPTGCESLLGRVDWAVDKRAEKRIDIDFAARTFNFGVVSKPLFDEVLYLCTSALKNLIFVRGGSKSLCQ